MLIIFLIITFLIGTLAIGLFFVIISTILIILKTKTKLLIILLIIGIIVFLISLIGILYFRTAVKKADKKQILDTGTKLYLKHKKKNGKDEEYFMYNGKKYIFFTGFDKVEQIGLGNIIFNSRSHDKPVANIIERNDIFLKLFYGATDRETILYTIKNYPDDSLLMEDAPGFYVYCEEEKFLEKNIYYENINNYKFYISHGSSGYFRRYSIGTEYMELYDREMVKEIYTYTGSGDFIQVPPEKECNYIRIFGISIDGIVVKNLAAIISYKNNLYKEFGVFIEEEAKGMAVLKERQSEYITNIVF